MTDPTTYLETENERVLTFRYRTDVSMFREEAAAARRRAEMFEAAAARAESLVKARRDGWLSHERLAEATKAAEKDLSTTTMAIFGMRSWERALRSPDNGPGETRRNR